MVEGATAAVGKAGAVVEKATAVAAMAAVGRAPAMVEGATAMEVAAMARVVAGREVVAGDRSHRNRNRSHSLSTQNRARRHYSHRHL